MELFDAIKGRRSIRRFKDSPVKDSDIRAIIDAARMAPSASNSQPWHFIVVKNKPIIEQMAEAVRKATDQLIGWSMDEKEKRKLEGYKRATTPFLKKRLQLLWSSQSPTSLTLRLY